MISNNLKGSIMRDLWCLGKPLTGLLLLVAAGQSSAHEYWIEPENYQIAPGAKLVAQLKVGQHFQGDAQAYLPGNIERFQISTGGTVVDVKSRIGDLPALNENLSREGLALISLVSNIFTLKYTEPGLFEKVLDYEGLDGILQEHRRRGLPISGFHEAYQRFAKSLIQVGEGSGEDRLLGLGFEWLLETNPYTATDNRLQARLYWRGEPLAATQARLFVRRPGRQMQESLLTTDSDGRIYLEPEPGSEILLNAVQMRVPSDLFRAPADSAWISYWTTTTFILPERVSMVVD
jgi:uncharacterized GH25 family protein